MTNISFGKKFAVMYSALTAALIPYVIYKLFETQDYLGSLNETMEGVTLMLCFQIVEALILVGVVNLVEKSFKKSISIGSLFLISLILQLFLLYLVT